MTKEEFENEVMEDLTTSGLSVVSDTNNDENIIGICKMVCGPKAFYYVDYLNFSGELDTYAFAAEEHELYDNVQDAITGLEDLITDSETEEDEIDDDEDSWEGWTLK